VAIDCDFGVRLNDDLKDKFVSGFKTSKVLERLCEEDPENKTLKSIVELALKYETTTKCTTVAATDINKLGDRYEKGQQYNNKKWINQKNLTSR